MYKLLLADDEYFVRMGLRETIDWEKLGIDYVGDADNGKDAYRLACELKPDIIITDIRMPGMDGLELMDTCIRNGLGAQFIVMSAHNEFAYAKGALQMGACDYILKPSSEEQIMQAVRKAIAAVEKEKRAQVYQTTIDNYKSAMKEHVLLKIAMDTSLSEEEVRAELDAVSMEISENANYVIYVRTRDYHLQLKQQSHDNLNNFHTALKDNICKSFSVFNERDWWLLSNERSSFVVILHEEEEEKNAVARLKNLMNEFCRHIERNYPDFSVTVGISRRTDGICGFSQGYTQAYMSAYLNPVIAQNCVNCFYEEADAEYRWEIMAALNYISAHYSEDISIETIAQELYISSSHLMHLFKDAMGKTLNECITEYRMQAAQLMLRNSNYNIAEISARAGYKNAKYFTRLFKRYTNMTPSEYARKPY